MLIDLWSRSKDCHFLSEHFLPVPTAHAQFQFFINLYSKKCNLNSEFCISVWLCLAYPKNIRSGTLMFVLVCYFVYSAIWYFRKTMILASTNNPIFFNNFKNTITQIIKINFIKISVIDLINCLKSIQILILQMGPGLILQRMACDTCLLPPYCPVRRSCFFDKSCFLKYNLLPSINPAPLNNSCSLV